MSDVVDILLQVASVMGLAVFAISVVLQVVTYARAHPVRPAAIVVGQAGSLLGMIVFSALTKRPPDVVLWVLLLAGGCVVGIVAGQLLRVQASPQGIVMRYALPGLLAWAVLLLFVQGSVTFAGTVPLAAYGAAIVILGVNIGMTVRVIARARGQRTSPGALTRAIGILLLAGVLLLPVPGYATPGEHPVRSGGGYHTEWKSLADAPAETRPYIVNGGGAVRETTWPCSGVFDIYPDVHNDIAAMNYAFDAGRQERPDQYEYWAKVEISVYPTPEDAHTAFEARYDALTLHPQANLYWLTRDHRAVLGADDSWVELHEYEYGWNSSGAPYAVVDQYWLLVGSMIIDINGGDDSGSLKPEIMKQHTLSFEKWLANCAQQIVDAARKRDLGPYLVATYLGGTGETGTGGGTGGKTGTGGGTGEATGPGPDGKYPPLTPLERGTATGAAGGLMLLGALLQLLLTLRTAQAAPPAAVPPAPAVPAAGPPAPGLPAVVPPASAKRGLFTLVGVLAAVVVLGVAVFILVPFVFAGTGTSSSASVSTGGPAAWWSDRISGAISSLMGGGGGPGDGVTDIRGTWVSTTPGKGFVCDVVGTGTVESGRAIRLESDVEWVIDGVDGGRATGKWRRVNIRTLLGGQSTAPVPDDAFHNIVVDIGKDGSLSTSTLRMQGTVEGDRIRTTFELTNPSASVLTLKGTMDLTRKK